MLEGTPHQPTVQGRRQICSQLRLSGTCDWGVQQNDARVHQTDTGTSSLRLNFPIGSCCVSFRIFVSCLRFAPRDPHRLCSVIFFPILFRSCVF